MVPWYVDTKLSGVMLGKLAIMRLFSCIILLLWTSKIIFYKEAKFVKTPFDIPLCAFSVIMIVATIFSINPHISFNGAYYRYEGLITFLNYVFLFYAAVNLLTKESLNRIINTIIFSGGLVSLYGLLQHWRIDLSGWGNYATDRVFSTFGNPVYLGAYLTTVFPISLAIFLREKKERKKSKISKKKDNKPNWLNYIYKLGPYWFGINLGLIVIGLILCRGRGAFFGVVISMLLFVSLGLWQKLKWNKNRIIPALLIIFSLGIYFNLGSEASVFKRFYDMIFPKQEVVSTIIKDSLPQPIKSAMGSRIIMWRDCLKIIADHPLLGTGPETFALIYPKYRSIDIIHGEGGQFGRPDRVHNDVLDLTICTGLLGLSAYLLMLFVFGLVCLKTFVHHQEKLLPLGLFCGGVGYFVQNQTCFWILPSTSLFFLIMGLSIIIQPQTREISLSKPVFNAIKILLPLVSVVITLLLSKNTIAYYKADIEFKKGTTLYWAGAKIDASTYFEKAIELNPKERQYYEYLLHSYLDTVAESKNNVKKAILAGQKVIGFYPQESIFRNLLASAYITNKQTDKAILQYQQILKLDPFFFDVRGKLANIYIEQKEYEKAISLCQDGLRLDPYASNLLESLGQLYLFQSKNELATEMFKKLVKIAPDNFNAHNNLAKIYYDYYEQNKETSSLAIEKVIEHCKEMIRIKPNDIEPHKNLGSLYYKAGRLKEAKQEFIHVLQIDPNNSYAKYLLGLINK